MRSSQRRDVERALPDWFEIHRSRLTFQLMVRYFERPNSEIVLTNQISNVILLGLPVFATDATSFLAKSAENQQTDRLVVHFGELAETRLAEFFVKII